MALDGISPALAIRSSVGIEIWNSPGFKQPYEPNERFIKDESKNCRTMTFSPDGQYFAYSNGTTLKVINTSDWKEKCTFPRPKAFYLKFSPRGNYLVTWELFMTTKDNTEGSPNMYVYKVETGEEMFSTIQKKQTDWEPCWSNDESLFGLMVGGEALFYELNGSDDFKSSAKKLGGGRNGSLSISPGGTPPFIVFYVPGTKGSPSMCKLYKYPALQQSQTVGCKSFFQADRVEMLWNKRGTGLLLLTSTEVDQTGASYYGKQALHFMSTKGDSFSVQLSKDGPIHSVSWSPKGSDFVVVYGYMPAKATLFNLKCDPVFDFGEAARNSIYFNDFGNLLLLGGFGNLRGYVEIWDMDKKTQISTLQAPDSTLLEWSPTGEVFLTATTAPRLRIGNGFKVWHYSGALLHETSWQEGQELLDITWQKYNEGTFKEKPISNEKIEGIRSIQPEASKQVYEPPSIRLMKEGKLPPEEMTASTPPGYPTQKSSSNSNRQRKQRRPKDKSGSDNYNKTKPAAATANNNTKNTDNQQKSPNATNKAENSNDTKDNKSSVTANHQQPHPHLNQQQKNDQNPHHYGHNRINSRYPQQRSFRSTGDPEKDKKIRHISRKLQDISKLKSKMNKGEHLEANQLSKIANEASLIEELKALKVSA